MNACIFMHAHAQNQLPFMFHGFYCIIESNSSLLPAHTFIQIPSTLSHTLSLFFFFCTFSTVYQVISLHLLGNFLRSPLVILHWGHPEVKTLINILPAPTRGEEKKALYLSGVLCSQEAVGEKEKGTSLSTFTCTGNNS